MVGTGLVEADRDAVAAADLVVFLAVDLDCVGEVVVVRPGDCVAGLDLDRLRVEAVALGHRHLGRRHRLAGARAAAARRDQDRAEHHGGREEEPVKGHECVTPSAGRRTTE